MVEAYDRELREARSSVEQVDDHKAAAKAAWLAYEDEVAKSRDLEI